MSVPYLSIDVAAKRQVGFDSCKKQHASLVSVPQVEAPLENGKGFLPPGQEVELVEVP